MKSCSPTQDEIARVLLAHPDVTNVAFIAEQGADGRDIQIAYVVADRKRVEAAKSRLYAAERDRRILQWRKTFDHAYRGASENFAPSFVGWTSNFTNKPIPEREMTEWLDCTVRRIQTLQAKRVLEVGCGVGLLVERLAPRCPTYCATDFSPVAVDRLHEFTAARPELRHVELLQREATDFSGLTSNSFDVVILNSVVQYFPSIEYLHDVLQQAARIVAPGGHIFVGDVRDLGLLDTFHGAVQLAKAPLQASAGWLKRRIHLAIEQERELVISPVFFLGLSGSLRSIAGADILLKRGSNNELTRYRYDVVLHVGEASSASFGQVREMQADAVAPEHILSYLGRGQIPAVRLLDVANSRVAGDVAAVQSLWSANDRQRIEQITRQSAPDAAGGSDPEAFWKLGDSSSYDVLVGCSPHSADGRFDVALADRRYLAAPPLARATIDLSKMDGRPLVTDPMAAAFMRQLGLELGEAVRARFPDAQQPAAVIAVNAIPWGDVTQEPSLVPQMASDGVGLLDSRTIDPGRIEMTTAAYNLGLKFEQVTASSPDALALVCEGNSHDFRTLNESANKLARWLATRGVSRGTVVCLELAKSFEAYALAIACIKIGAPYAFLDPHAPMERARLMLERCKPVLVVSSRNGPGNRITICDASARANLRSEFLAFDGSNLSETALITGADPAYVMFTSGSTGEPKGVVIPHQGVLHLIDWARNDLAIGPEDRLTNVNPIYFDNSVFDIYAGLLNGAAIVALDALKGRPPAELVAEITRHRCTFFFAVPTLFMFLDSMHLLTPDWLPSVSRFMFGGEGFPLARLRRFYEAFAGKAKLINCYGPTETSCICSGFEIVESVFDTTEGLAPLGRLNANFSYRILDEHLQPVAPGGVGELWLGGPGVGLGYLNNPQETERRFCQDPLVPGYRSVLYRSGDLVEVDPQTGILRFRGRADNQVKLRGYRVELEEVDHVMTSMAGVTRALAVVLRDANGTSRLVAAYSGTRVADVDLHSHCAARLPTYMIPSKFVWLECVPVNANGKADRRAVATLLDQARAKAS